MISALEPHCSIKCLRDRSIVYMLRTIAVHLVSVLFNRLPHSGGLSCGSDDVICLGMPGPPSNAQSRQLDLQSSDGDGTMKWHERLTQAATSPDAAAGDVLQDGDNSAIQALAEFDADSWTCSLCHSKLPWSQWSFPSGDHDAEAWVCGTCKAWQLLANQTQLLEQNEALRKRVGPDQL